MTAGAFLLAMVYCAGFALTLAVVWHHEDEHYGGPSVLVWPVMLLYAALWPVALLAGLCLGPSEDEV